MQESRVSRRSFVSSLASGAFGFTIVPRHVLGGPGFTAPSDRINFAVVGAGAQGLSNARAAIGGDQQLVAFADVDMAFVEGPMKGGVSYEVRPDGEGAVASVHNRGGASFSVPGMAWMLRKSVAKDLERLAAIVEGGA